MKKLLKTAILGGILAINTAFAATVNVFYQPTPFPTWKYNSTTSSPKPIPQNLVIVHAWMGWFGSYYNKTLVQDGYLQIGGWGDYYYDPIRFDLTGLPSGVDYAQLYLYAIPSGAPNPSQMSIWRITSSWDPATIGASNFPATNGGYYWPVSTTVNAWRAYNIRTWYEAWKAGTYTNYGMLLAPYNSDGTSRFDRFVSMRSTDTTHRPMLLLVFTPSMTFKMPIASGTNSIVTNEIGGYECRGVEPWPDVYHQGSNYFSIDIAGVSERPIIAPAWGKVIYAGGNNNTGATADPNGFNATIDHDGDGNPATGFQTRYLHLFKLPARKDGTLLKAGDIVNTGDQIGLMGTSGYVKGTSTPTSTGVHLHLGFRYQNSGSSFSNELAKVVMEGRLLKSYQTECSVDSTGKAITWTRAYGSTNVATGK